MRARIALVLLSMVALGTLTQAAFARSDGPRVEAGSAWDSASGVTPPLLRAQPIASPLSRAGTKESALGPGRIERATGFLRGSAISGSRAQGDPGPRAPVTPAGHDPASARFPFAGVPWMPFVLLAAFLITAVGLKRLS
jgi:hypothetical protein